MNQTEVIKMKAYKKPEIKVEMFATEEVIEASSIVTKAKIAVPLGKENTLQTLNS